MCRAGGPRCAGGKGKSKGTSTTSVATPAVAPGGRVLDVDRAAQKRVAARSSGVVPTRDHVDLLASDLPADRKGWDGKPLNEKDRRFYALRESGYTGPIDQEGYPDTTSEGAGILRRMARDRGETVNW